MNVILVSGPQLDYTIIMFRKVEFTLALLKKNQVRSLLRPTPEIIFLKIILDASSVHTDI